MEGLPTATSPSRFGGQNQGPRSPTQQCQTPQGSPSALHSSGSAWTPMVPTSAAALRRSAAAPSTRPRNNSGGGGRKGRFSQAGLGGGRLGRGAWAEAGGPPPTLPQLPQVTVMRLVAEDRYMRWVRLDGAAPASWAPLQVCLRGSSPGSRRASAPPLGCCAPPSHCSTCTADPAAGHPLTGTEQ